MAQAAMQTTPTRTAIQNDTFSTSHNFEGIRGLDEHCFRWSLSSEMWHYVAHRRYHRVGAICYLHLLAVRNTGTCLPDYTTSHLNNHHNELPKSRKLRFHGCSKLLGIFVILFFGLIQFLVWLVFRRSRISYGLRYESISWGALKTTSETRRQKWTQIYPSTVPLPCFTYVRSVTVSTMCGYKNNHMTE
jgi:hypothetical protein